MPTTSITSTIIQQQQHQQQSQQQSQQPPPPPPPVDHSSLTSSSTTTPLTVRDLMSNVIEKQMKNNPAGPVGPSIPGSSGTPTISSILKTDHRNDITFVREYKPSSSMSSTAMSNRDSNLATLSVVSVPHHTHRSAAASPQQIGTLSFSYHFTNFDTEAHRKQKNCLKIRILKILMHN